MLRRCRALLSAQLPGGLKLWITLLTLGFVGWALAGHAAGLRSLAITARGWWWLTLALGLSWLSLIVMPSLMVVVEVVLKSMRLVSRRNGQHGLSS